jgi:hypothetical protein
MQGRNTGKLKKVALNLAYVASLQTEQRQVALGFQGQQEGRLMKWKD